MTIGSIYKLLDKLEMMILKGIPVPFTPFVIVNHEKVIDVLDKVRACIPGEIQEAHGIIKRSEDIQMEAQRRAENILIEAKEKAALAKQNAQSVVSKFTEKFGEKAEEAFITLAKDTGMSVQQLNTLASTSPKVVIKLAGLGEGNERPPASSNGSVNTQTMNNQPKELSAKVPRGATTADMVNAWKAAGEKIKQNLNT